MIFQSCVFGPIWAVKDVEKRSKRRPGHETFLRHTGKAKRKQRNASRKLTLEAAIPAALQPKQMPGGYNVAEFSKDLHFILLHVIMIGDLAAPK